MTVEVSQADRDAASAYVGANFGVKCIQGTREGTAWTGLSEAFARHRIAHQGKVSGDVPVLLEEWLERRVYKGSDEYRSYLSARFPRTGGAPSPFDFDGHKWAYYVTSFDDKGGYDVIRRRVPKASTPTPTVKDSLTGDVAELARQLNDESCGFGIGHAYLMQKAADKLTELAAKVDQLQSYLPAIPPNSSVQYFIRKSSQVVKASQWFKLGDHPAVYVLNFPCLLTLSGPIRVREGDWIVSESDGSYKTYRPEIFHALYSPVTPTT